MSPEWGWEVHGGSGRSSGIWKGILSVLEPFTQSIRYHLGKGDRIRFWLDTWIKDSPLATQFPNLFRCAKIGKVLVSDYVEREEGRIRWGPTFRRNLSVVEETQFCSLLTLINDVYLPLDGWDSRIWPHSTDGSFSVASFMMLSTGRTLMLLLFLRCGRSRLLLRS